MAASLPASASGDVSEPFATWPRDERTEPAAGTVASQKWGDIIACGLYSYQERHPDEFCRMVRRGIPAHLRWQVWRQALLVQGVGEARRLLEGSCSADAEVDQQIERDLPRTFSAEQGFGRKGQCSLGRILRAYSNHQPSVGYCQGMNFIAGLLLLVAETEVEALAAFVYLMDFRGLADLFRCGFPLLRRYQRSFLCHLSQTMPDLLEHFDKMQVTHSQYLAPWFLTLFIKALPLSLVKVVWDIIICEGLIASIRIAIAILRACRPILLCLDLDSIDYTFKLMKCPHLRNGQAPFDVGVQRNGRAQSAAESEQAELNSFWVRLLLWHIQREDVLPVDLLLLTEDTLQDGDEIPSDSETRNGAAASSASHSYDPDTAQLSDVVPTIEYFGLPGLVQRIGQRVAAPLTELAEDSAVGLVDALEKVRSITSGRAWASREGLNLPQ